MYNKKQRLLDNSAVCAKLIITIHKGYKMFFIQESRTNIKNAHVRPLVANVCDGCHAHCKISYTYCPFACHIYPEIGGSRVRYFFDKDGSMKSAGIIVNKSQLEQQIATAMEMGRSIAPLCDRYRTK